MRQNWFWLNVAKVSSIFLRESGSFWKRIFFAFRIYNLFPYSTSVQVIKNAVSCRNLELIKWSFSSILIPSQYWRPLRLQSLLASAHHLIAPSHASRSVINGCNKNWDTTTYTLSLSSNPTQTHILVLHLYFCDGFEISPAKPEIMPRQRAQS